MTVTEQHIRDHLATDLDILERGLTLIRTNYPLPNAYGTRGFVDILARDADGALVVIEVKRSNSTAREAVHEVVKYVALLRQEQGVNRADVRAVIVSTEWAELLVPFSNLKREWGNEIRGYHVHLAQDGPRIASATEVTAVPEADARGLSPVHFTVAPLSLDHLDGLWRTITTALASAGAIDALGIVLRHEDGDSALYVVIGRAPHAKPADVISHPPTRTGTTENEPAESQAYDKVDDDVEVDEVDEWAIEHAALEAVADRLHESNYLVRPAYADKFEMLTDSGGWQPLEVLRQGIFHSQRDLYPDDTLLGQVFDRLGLSQVKYLGSARPANHQHWTQFRLRVAQTMVGADSWGEIIAAWLDERESQLDQRTVVQIYNPGDFIGSLVFGWPDDLHVLLPRMTAAIDVAGPGGRILEGFLAWTGSTPATINHTIQAVYPDPVDWGFAKSMGHAWADDRHVLHGLGLKYVLFEFQPGDDPPVRLELDHDRLIRRPLSEYESTPDQCYPLPKFLEQFAEEIESLVTAYRAQIDVDWKSATVLVTNDLPFVPRGN
ncbi:DUF91 domain-containing protein [Actinoplanes bogorensis]|uniref:DUF91 domain-containing protein n=1 Tax=Paractinoplanes bogorensis TaxID=1610840 RepID=A0ABS5YYK3_9ACTN|nr:DUF91 domain-containing protein [Actinoplanes bogorensis]